MLEFAMRLADRRDALSKLQPTCGNPLCQSRQMQLVDYHVTPAKWRCRECHWPEELDLPDDPPL